LYGKLCFLGPSIWQILWGKIVKVTYTPYTFLQYMCGTFQILVYIHYPFYFPTELPQLSVTKFICGWPVIRNIFISAKSLDNVLLNCIYFKACIHTFMNFWARNVWKYLTIVMYPMAIIFSHKCFRGIFV